jgi:hypothetical protein
VSNALRTPRAHPEPVGQKGWKRDERLVQDVMVGKMLGDGGNGDDDGGNEDDDGGNEDDDGGNDDGGNEDDDGGGDDGGDDDGGDDDGNRLRTIYGNLHTPQSNCPQPKPTTTYVLSSQQSWQHVLLSSMM